MKKSVARTISRLRHSSSVRPNVGLGILSLALWAPVSAHAQVLNEYFSDMGRGVGELWVDPEQTQVASEYRPLGWRLGGFNLDAGLNEGIGYASNANRLPGGQPSAVVSTAAQVGIESNWNADRLYANASVSDQRYLEQSIEDQTNWTAALGGYHDLGHDRIGFDYSHLNLVQTPNTLGGFATIQPVKYQVNRAALSYTLAQDGRFSLIPEASITSFLFDQNALLPSANGTSVSQGYRDRAVILESLTARYRIAPSTAALLVMRGTEIRYTDSLAGYPGRDSNGAAVLAGLNYETAHLINVRVLAGYQRRYYRNSLYPDIVSPIVEAQASWAPTRLTRVDLSAQHGIEDSAFENSAGFTFTTLRLGIEHQYQRNILISAYFTFQQGHYQNTPTVLIGSSLMQPGGNQTIVGGGLSAQWLISQHLNLGLDYDVSNQNVVGTTGSFMLNQIMIKANLTL